MEHNPVSADLSLQSVNPGNQNVEKVARSASPSHDSESVRIPMSNAGKEQASSQSVVRRSSSSHSHVGKYFIIGRQNEALNQAFDDISLPKLTSANYNIRASLWSGRSCQRCYYRVGIRRWLCCPPSGLLFLET